MRTRPSRSQSGKSEEQEETPLASRKRQLRSWLILGAGAVGVAGAIAKWAVQARQGAVQASDKNRLSRGELAADLSTRAEGTGTPVPLQEMPSSAAPTNDARTALTTPEVTSAPSSFPTSEAETTAVSSDPSAKKARTGKTGKSAPGVADKETPPASTSRKRGKMSEEYDQALQANSLPQEDFKEEFSRRGTEIESMTTNNSSADSFAAVNRASPSGAQPGSAASLDATRSPAEQALSTQAEGKLAIGQELRDREFPVPPEKSGAASQKLVVDQETMHDGGPRQGGAIGTMPGDHQNKGEVGDIEDQAAKTPDFAQQR